MVYEIFKKIVLGLIPLRHQLPLRFWYERLIGRLEPEMDILNELLSSKKLVVDVGANIGLYSYFLSKSGKDIEAFEPLPECANAINAYRSPCIRVHNVALSSMPGTLELYTPIINGVPYPGNSSFTAVTGPHESREVSVHTLDQYNYENVCLIKIDVEGHELDVLKGATQTLLRERPVLLIEIEQRHLKIPMAEVFAYVVEQKYNGFFLFSGSLSPLSNFVYEIHQAPENVNSQAYINNFIFLPEGTPVPKHLQG